MVGVRVTVAQGAGSPRRRIGRRPTRLLVTWREEPGIRPSEMGRWDVGPSGAGEAGSSQKGDTQRNIVHLPAARRSGPNPGALAQPRRTTSEPGFPVLGPRTADCVQ